MSIRICAEHFHVAYMYSVSTSFPAFAAPSPFRSSSLLSLYSLLSSPSFHFICTIFYPFFFNFPLLIYSPPPPPSIYSSSSSFSSNSAFHRRIIFFFFSSSFSSSAFHHP